MNTLRDAIEEYIALRRCLGFKLHEPQRWLREFASFMEEQGATFITTERALQWALRPHVPILHTGLTGLWQCVVLRVTTVRRTPERRFPRPIFCPIVPGEPAPICILSRILSGCWSPPRDCVLRVACEASHTRSCWVCCPSQVCGLVRRWPSRRRMSIYRRVF